MDETDSCGCSVAHRRERDSASVELERAGSRRLDTRENLDERRLARAIFTDQGMDIAGPRREGHAFQRGRTRIDLRDLSRVIRPLTSGRDHRAPSMES